MKLKAKQSVTATWWLHWKKGHKILFAALCAIGYSMLGLIPGIFWMVGLYWIITALAVVQFKANNITTSTTTQ